MAQSFVRRVMSGCNIVAQCVFLEEPIEAIVRSRVPRRADPMQAPNGSA
jgi:hypothetical protein